MHQHDVLPERKDWPESIKTSGAFAAKQLETGSWAFICNMAFGNVRLNIVHDPVGDPFTGANDFYCYHDTGWALLALIEWEGEGDPDGWVRHFGTARRREYELDRTTPTKEWINP